MIKTHGEIIVKRVVSFLVYFLLCFIFKWPANKRSNDVSFNEKTQLINSNIFDKNFNLTFHQFQNRNCRQELNSSSILPCHAVHANIQDRFESSLFIKVKQHASFLLRSVCSTKSLQSQSKERFIHRCLTIANHRVHLFI